MISKREIVKELFKKGITQSEIARRLKISRQRVHQIIRDYTSPATIRYKLDARERELLRGKKSEEIKLFIANKLKERQKKVDNYLSGIIGRELKNINITKLTGMRGSSRDRLRELVRIRDNHTCQVCKKVWQEGKRRFDVHHDGEEIDGKTFSMSVMDLDRKNLHRMITVCHKCHLNLPISISKMSKSKGRKG